MQDEAEELIFSSLKKRTLRRDFTGVYSHLTKDMEKTKPNSPQRCTVMTQKTTNTIYNKEHSD